MSELASHVLWDLVWAGLAALGFAILLSVPKKVLLTSALIGACTHATRLALIESHLAGIELATLLVSIGAGFAAVAASRAHRVLPVTVFSSVGLIPMVPGFLAYRAVINLVKFVTIGDPKLDFLALSLRPALQTALILGGMGIGAAIPLMLVPVPALALLDRNLAPEKK